MNHIQRIAFSGMRRLHPFRAAPAEMLRNWSKERAWLQFSSINVFIGANGAGKSTVLDLIDLLREPGRLATLPRENRPHDSLAAFHIVFCNEDFLVAHITQSRITGYESAANIDAAKDNPHDIQCVSIYARAAGNPNLNLKRNISKFAMDEHTQSEMKTAFAEFGVNVAYWTGEQETATDALAAELNHARRHLCGVLSEIDYLALPWDSEAIEGYKRATPWRADGARLSVYLSDDPLQQNNVAVAALPAGWRQLASILSWLRNLPHGSVCLLEEPETHLHPHLQRYLAEVIGSLTEPPHQLQVFIATHSPVFQQINLWPHGAALFEARPDKITPLNSAWPVLEALGIKSSDLSQSNGVIWVEGPSDRLYIRHWLKLHCIENKTIEPVENVDYAFCFYGGAALTHFDADSIALIDMLRINRNLAIVFDRDNDFALDAEGRLQCVAQTSAKHRVLEKLKTLKELRFHAWITDGYTIESYLPDALRSEHFDDKDGTLTLKPHHRKVGVAMKYQREFTSLAGFSCLPDLLTDHIARLLAHIRSWNYQ